MYDDSALPVSETTPAGATLVSYVVEVSYHSIFCFFIFETRLERRCRVTTGTGGLTNFCRGPRDVGAV